MRSFDITKMITQILGTEWVFLPVFFGSPSGSDADFAAASLASSM